MGLHDRAKSQCNPETEQRDTTTRSRITQLCKIPSGPTTPPTIPNSHAIPRNGRTRPPESIEQAGAQGGFVLPLRGDCESQIGKDIRAGNRTAKRRQSTTIRKAITPQNASQLHEPTHISATGHRIPAILIIHMQSAIMLRSQRDCSTDVQEHTELATAGLHRKRPRTSQRNLQHVFGNP